MILTLGLAAYAAAGATAAPAVLRRSSWTQHAPGIAILAWLALTFTILLAVMLSGLALWWPAWVETPEVRDIPDLCAQLVSRQYASPAGAATGTIGLLLAVGVGARVASCAITSWGRVVHARRTQRRWLSLTAAHADDGLDYLVVPHRRPAAYCVPGRGGRVILTSGAVASLDGRQVSAVVAHELAHLRGRHHLAVAAAEVVRRAFPFVPAFTASQREIARLAEVCADDYAVGRTDRITVMTALLVLAEGQVRPGTMAAGGASALARASRLSAPPAPIGAGPAMGLLLGSAYVVLAPTVVLAASASALMYCPGPWTV